MYFSNTFKISPNTQIVKLKKINNSVKGLYFNSHFNPKNESKSIEYFFLI